MSVRPQRWGEERGSSTWQAGRQAGGPRVCSRGFCCSYCGGDVWGAAAMDALRTLGSLLETALRAVLAWQTLGALWQLAATAAVRVHNGSGGGGGGVGGG